MAHIEHVSPYQTHTTAEMYVTESSEWNPSTETTYGSNESGKNGPEQQGNRDSHEAETHQESYGGYNGQSEDQGGQESRFRTPRVYTDMSELPKQGFSYGDAAGNRRQVHMDPRDTLTWFEEEEEETPLKHRTDLVGIEELTRWRNSLDRVQQESVGTKTQKSITQALSWPLDSTDANLLDYGKDRNEKENGGRGSEETNVNFSEDVTKDKLHQSGKTQCGKESATNETAPVSCRSTDTHEAMSSEKGSKYQFDLIQENTTPSFTSEDRTEASGTSTASQTHQLGRTSKQESARDYDTVTNVAYIPLTCKGLWEFFVSELNWGTTRKHTTASNEHIVNMLKVPLYFEKFVAMAWFICLDLFLHNLTLLPLRFIYSLWSISSSMLNPMSKRPLRRAVVYDLVRGLTIVLACYVLSFVQISRVYHYIRGEAIIKLYVIFNILEIFDKLLASFGQDVLDGLYRATVQHANSLVGLRWIHEPWKVATVIMHVVIAALYVVVHSILQFLQIVCINVAINSHGNALFTLLISNNFMELKSSVFKKFAPENLFQISASDAVERFQLALFLMLIILQDISSLRSLLMMVPTTAGIWLSECLIDWTKHCFISKFNRMHSNVYNKYISLLALDTVNTHKTLNSCLDPTHRRGRRLGLATLPLTCVLFRLLSIKLYSSRVELLSTDGIYWLASTFVLLLIFKMMLSFCLLQISTWWLRSRFPAHCDTTQGSSNDSLISLSNGTHDNVDPATLLQGGGGFQGDSSDTMEKIRGVSRYTLHGNRVPL